MPLSYSTCQMTLSALSKTKQNIKTKQKNTLSLHYISGHPYSVLSFFFHSFKLQIVLTVFSSQQVREYISNINKLRNMCKLKYRNTAQQSQKQGCTNNLYQSQTTVCHFCHHETHIKWKSIHTLISVHGPQEDFKNSHTIGNYVPV